MARGNHVLGSFAPWAVCEGHVLLFQAMHRGVGFRTIDLLFGGRRWRLVSYMGRRLAKTASASLLPTWVGCFLSVVFVYSLCVSGTVCRCSALVLLEYLLAYC
jgi:hypothetical protein